MALDPISAALGGAGLQQQRDNQPSLFGAGGYIQRQSVFDPISMMPTSGGFGSGANDPIPWGTQSDPFQLGPDGLPKGGWGVMDVMNRYAPPPDPFDPALGVYAPSGGPMGSPADAKWALVNRYDSITAKVSAQTGVPANVIKAIMWYESRGELDAVSPQTSSGRYFGLMQVGATSSVPEYMKSADWMRGNPERQILAGATELANKYRAVGATSWEQAAAAYFGFGTDVLGTSTNTYVNAFRANMTELANAGGSGAGMNAPGGAGGLTGTGGNAMTTMFGGRASLVDWGAFGVNSSNGLYDYGADMGLNGLQHTGLDVPLPRGTPLFAPSGATVICPGGPNCGSFGDWLGGGIGRIELQMPDGARVIYGHSNTANVRAGQQVAAGTQIGTSGGMNSWHTHLEVRVPDPSTPSGWRLVDPLQYFGSGYQSVLGSGGISAGYSPGSTGWVRQHALNSLFPNNPSTGTGGAIYGPASASTYGMPSAGYSYNVNNSIASLFGG
jgi:murein DD-endopeptidase MepM/ murein hydrolase activator NlpD